MGKTKKHTDRLTEQLKDPKEAAAYLDACLQDGDIEIFLLAVRDVVKAHSSVSEVAKEAKLNRESLYKSLSKTGNPRLNNLMSVLSAIGMEIHVKPVTKPRNLAA